MTVAPVLAAVFETQNESRLHRCLSECYIDGENLVSKAISARGGLIFEVHCAYSKTSPLPCWARSTVEKGGGAHFREGTVHVLTEV